MEAIVLGSGSADGWPNPFCACASCTTERAAGRVRGQSSVLVDGTLLLDCGPETPRAAERAGVTLTGLRHVLITHRHPDHCAPAFLLFRSWVGADPLDVVGPAEVVEQARMWVAPDSPVRFVTVSAGDRLRLGDYDIAVLAARHDGESVLYDVAAPSGRLLYATDTGPLPQDTVDAVRDAAFDLVLMEETFGDHTAHGTDHLDLVSFPEQVRRLRVAGALTEHTDLVAVHLSHHNPPTAELDRRLAAWGARTVPDGTRLSPGPRHTTRPAIPQPALPHTTHPAVPQPAHPTPLSAEWSSPLGTTPPTGQLLWGQPELSPEELATRRSTGVRRTLVLGGARSGKSREAERLLAAEPQVTYVATSYPAGDDPEWTERIRIHQADRPAHWRTLETLALADLLGEVGEPLLVDCLTLWLTRIMDAHGAWEDEVWAATGEKAVADEVDTLVAAWRTTRRRVVAVSNEVGQGVVPDSASGRRFRDLMGRLNARLAAETEDVRWCAAGRVVRL